MNVLLTILFVAGLVLLAIGAWLAYEPAGFIVAGLTLVLVPIFYVRGAWVSSTE